jgi:hypothetical protein
MVVYQPMSAKGYLVHEIVKSIVLKKHGQQSIKDLALFKIKGTFAVNTLHL